MELSSPLLSTGNATDFALELEVGNALSSPNPSSNVLSPLAPLSEGLQSGLSVALDANLAAELIGRKHVMIEDFALPGTGPVDLELVAVPLPWSADAVVMVDGQSHDPHELIGDLALFRGSVVGHPDSNVFLSLSEHGSRGWVRLAQESSSTVHLMPESGGVEALGAPARLVWTPQLEALTGVAAEGVERGCAGALRTPGAVSIKDEPPTSDIPAPAGLTLAGARIAIETDFQFYQRFGSIEAATTYVTQLMGALGDRYFTDVQCTLEVAYLGLYSDSEDPWTTPETSGMNTADMLQEFRGSWGSNWPADADLAHFLSGANLGGGIAYVDVLCDRNFGFGVSASITGFIEFSTFNGASSPLNWDYVVIGHELGHNFGADHTHEYCPPLDECYDSCNEGTTCGRGTIMSYCHTCAGGVGNIDLEFHPTVANIMRSAINSSCLGNAQLDAGDAISLRVRFTPGSEGPKTTQLVVPTDAPNVGAPNFTLTLTGN